MAAFGVIHLKDVCNNVAEIDFLSIFASIQPYPLLLRTVANLLMMPITVQQSFHLGGHPIKGELHQRGS